MTLDAICSFRLRLHGEVRAIERGQSIELDTADAERLLQKAPDRVRLAASSATHHVTLESVEGLTPVFWESHGRIVGPGRVSHFAKDRHEFWLCLEFDGAVFWVRDDLLRSRKAFEEQSKRVCNCCQGGDFWESIYHVRICRLCHPPASAQLEKGAIPHDR